MGSVTTSGVVNPAFEPDSLERVARDQTHCDNAAGRSRKSGNATKVDYDRANRNAQTYYGIAGGGNREVSGDASVLKRSSSAESLSSDGSRFSRAASPDPGAVTRIDIGDDESWPVDMEALAKVVDWDFHPVDPFDISGDRGASRLRSSSVSSTESDESGVGTAYTDGSASTRWVFQPRAVAKSTRTMATQTPSFTERRPPVLPSRAQVQRHGRIGVAVGALTGAVAFGGAGACVALGLGAGMALTAPAMLAVAGASALVGGLTMGLIGARIGGATQAGSAYDYLSKASDEEVIGWYCMDPRGGAEAVAVTDIETPDNRVSLLRSWLVALSRTREFLADHEGVRDRLRPILLDAAQDSGKLARLSVWLEEGLSARREAPPTLSARLAGLARGRIDGVDAYRLLEGFELRAGNAVIDALWADQLAVNTGRTV